MVNVPVPTTLATAEPLMEPIRPEATTALSAGPDLILPAMSLMKSEQPEASRNAPNITNMKMTVAETLMVVPNRPSRSVARNLQIRSRE